MSYAVDFNTVSTVELESSPVAAALAGLRANESRYLKNKYDHVFTVEPANNAKKTIDWVHRILEEERDIVISSLPLAASAFQIENIRMAYVFYESGLSINVMYTVDDPNKRAVGFKLSEGMEVPAELASKFKFARQKSKLAGPIRGSYFHIKNEYPPPTRPGSGDLGRGHLRSPWTSSKWDRTAAGGVFLRCRRLQRQGLCQRSLRPHLAG